MQHRSILILGDLYVRTKNLNHTDDYINLYVKNLPYLDFSTNPQNNLPPIYGKFTTNQGVVSFDKIANTVK